MITHDIGIPQAAIDATISDQQHIDPIAPDSPLSGEVKVEENKDKDKDKKKKKHGEGKHNGNGIDGGQNAQITTDNTGAAVGTNSVPTTTSQPNCDVNVGTNGQPAGVDASNVVPVVTPTDNNVTPVPVVTPNPVVVDPTAGQQPTTTTTTTTESIPVRTVPTVPTTPITPESQQSQQAPSATLSVSIDNSQAATIQNKIIKAGKRNKLHGDHDSKGKYSSTDMTSHRGNKVETGQKNSQTVPVNDNGAVIISTPT